MTGPSAWPGSGWRPAGPGTGLAGTRTRVHQLVTQHGDNCQSLARKPAVRDGCGMDFTQTGNRTEWRVRFAGSLNVVAARQRARCVTRLGVWGCGCITRPGGGTG